MPDSAAPTAAEPQKTAGEQSNDLLENLRELGAALPVSFHPSAADGGAITAGIVYYLATGSLVAPVVEAPDEATERAALREQTELNEQKARVAELKRQLAATKAGPSPVAPPVAEAPAPTAPVDPVTATPSEPGNPPSASEPAAPLAGSTPSEEQPGS
jgi:hypothetical protein